MITALTGSGTVTIEPDVALSDLKVGDLVLGSPSPDIAPRRTLYRVVKPYGSHRCPLEAPASRLARVVSGLLDGRQLGILVELVEAGVIGEPQPAMFTAASTPALDRVVDRASTPNATR